MIAVVAAVEAVGSDGDSDGDVVRIVDSVVRTVGERVTGGGRE